MIYYCISELLLNSNLKRQLYVNMFKCYMFIYFLIFHMGWAHVVHR